MSALDALGAIRTGHRIFVHGCAATPLRLLDALVQRADAFRNVELVHLHTEGPAVYTKPEYAKSFRVANLFVGSNMRHRMDGDRIDYLPCYLSEVPRLFRSRRRPIDVALIHVSPPDRHGFCSLGTSVDVAAAAVEVASHVIAQVNPNMPRVHGDGQIHVDRLNAIVKVDDPLIEHEPHALSTDAKAIASNVAGLVPDGATLQVGIGAIPDAVLAALKTHRHLGIHTETWSDGVLDLIECGAVDNSRKVVHPGKTVSGFVTGTRRLYDFIDDNPSVHQLDIGFVNDVRVISRNPNVVALNSAVEVDLTGQVCADSVGTRIISGVGGQVDFIRGAALSEGGRAIIAMTSRTARGRSRIVPMLQPGAGVVTTRADSFFVVTECGIADLYGKTLHERAQALVAIAHPDDREEIARAGREGRPMRYPEGQHVG
ncbi:MAG: acetyl-CoA hydrolase/transferase C-terminal domain-containing protein [Polyangiaceae bacterium]